jgi:hypothetical protein
MSTVAPPTRSFARRLLRYGRRLCTYRHWERQAVRTLSQIGPVRSLHNKLYRSLRPYKYADACPSRYSEICEQIRKDGYYLIPNFLDRATVDQIRSELAGGPTQFVTPYWESCKQVASTSPTVAKLLVNEFFIDIASLYIGVHARPITYAVWSTHPSQGQHNGTDTWHSDRGDFHWLLFFIYLTDVDEDSGPHVYVRGSHTKRPPECGRWWKSLGHRIDESRLRQYFPNEEFQTFCLPAGSLIIEDTYGVHRGMPAKTKSRTMFEVGYGLHPQWESDLWVGDMGQLPDEYYAQLTPKQRESLDVVLKHRGRGNSA